jgi:hypothetical protein
MLKIDQIKSFERDGFLRIPGVFSESQIADLRHELDLLFQQPVRFEGDLQAHGNRGSIRCDIFARYPQFRWLLFHQALYLSVSSLLGHDFGIIPETAAHSSGYGDWHRDLTSHEKAGFRHKSESSLKMVTLAIYLQDNTDKGGGLDVVPGSHRRYRKYRPFPVFLKPYEQKMRRWFSRKILGDQEYVIPSLAGDLVIFDCKIKHKASWPKVARGPEDPTKYAIFLTACANNKEMHDFVSYLSTVEALGYVKNHKYPADLLSESKSHGINLIEFNHN